eukprot:CAMPEP_0174926980 /NCGR_PEP_ID=MMETSP1355-20121228/16818_1 /TAXON_ID=464990 /ORGANISM="Hemiselmis tepida, Strain CCMP443" /LENGTH=98 /DNA_ID=CAMNT_0016173051 /DNA_START=28 /DNA_END=321 /DNA_ORIENTATION=-
MKVHVLSTPVTGEGDTAIVPLVSPGAKVVTARYPHTSDDAANSISSAERVPEASVSSATNLSELMPTLLASRLLSIPSCPIVSPILATASAAALSPPP